MKYLHSFAVVGGLHEAYLRFERGELNTQQIRRLLKDMRHIPGLQGTRARIAASIAATH
jgi:hypothetical protein